VSSIVPFEQVLILRSVHFLVAEIDGKSQWSLQYTRTVVRQRALQSLFAPYSRRVAVARRWSRIDRILTRRVFTGARQQLARERRGSAVGLRASVVGQIRRHRETGVGRQPGRLRHFHVHCHLTCQP